MKDTNQRQIPPPPLCKGGNIVLLPPLKKGGWGGFFLLLASCFLLHACGGGLYTNSAQQELLSDTSSAPPNTVQITKNAFIFGSDFPADIVIPDIDGMRDTAFVVTTSNPAGVVAIDLTTNPLSLSNKFAGLISPSGSGFPASIAIMNESRAFLVTSSHVIDFNPTTGAVNKTEPLGMTLKLPSQRLLSDSSGAVRSITTSYPSSAAVAGSKLFISTSNYINPLTPAFAAPGTVLIFDIFESAPFIQFSAFIVTTDYNPSGITKISDERIAVSNSGVSDLKDSHAIPKTKASIDIIDAATSAVTANIPLGTVGLSFQEMATTSDGARGFIGSISYGEIYEIDLVNLTAVHTHTNPITITGNDVGSDYLSAQALSRDGRYLFVSSFETSAVYPVDITVSPPKVNPSRFSVEPFNIGFTSDVNAENPSGTNTGAGPIALRPGVPDVDFSGPEIFVLTGYPGTLVAIATNSDMALDEASPPVEPPPPPPAVNTELPKPDPNSKSCIGFAKAVKDVNISSGGGLNYLNLPKVALGPPEPENDSYGKAGASGTIAGIVSIGPGGNITLDMGECKIIDGNGPDFIVFENAFFVVSPKTPLSVLPQKAIDSPEDVDVFAEPGTVSVSEDGTTFYPFPCDPDIPQTPIGTVSFYDGLQSGCAGVTPVLYGKNPLIAGLEEGAGGDAFDLADIGLKKARYVKITASGTYKKPADPNNPGNGFGGFDFDAVAVINGEKSL